MAQPNSIQREPSMEEILASIRRIIEDSDTGKPVVETRRADAPAPAARASEVADLDAFRAEALELTAPEETATSRDNSHVDALLQPVESEVAPPSRLFGADFELRSTFAPLPETAPHSVEPAPAGDRIDAEQTKPATPEAKAETVALETNVEHFAADPVVASSDASIFDEAHALPENEATLDDAFSGIEDLLNDELQAGFATTEVPQGFGTQTSIVSHQTGRQVAAAFGELSEAFAASRQKSFDEMAEAMIRPMLSEWLDNNLPTLVERLVREEIERIARGPGN